MSPEECRAYDGTGGFFLPHVGTYKQFLFCFVVLSLHMRVSSAFSFHAPPPSLTPSPYPPVLLPPSFPQKFNLRMHFSTSFDDFFPLKAHLYQSFLL